MPPALHAVSAVAQVLPALPVQYPDFALWQAEHLYQSVAVARGIKKLAELYMATPVGSAPVPDFPGVPCESVCSEHQAQRPVSAARPVVV